jgi:hypothetical protein
MLIGHHHAPGPFDAGHCRACWTTTTASSRRKPSSGRPAMGSCGRRQALWALASSGIGVLLAVLALLTR